MWMVLSRFPKEPLAFYVYLTWMESIVWKWAAPFSLFLSERGISIATTRGIRNYAKVLTIAQELKSWTRYRTETSLTPC